jgi:glyoxylase-like metal-dependent hydrolase (beta-lactamase superfamily II)
MKQVEYVECFTAGNPGPMTLGGTNQYLLGRDEITVIDVALPTDENIRVLLERAAARGGGKIEKILLTHIHKDHSGGALELKKRSGAKLGLFASRRGFLGAEDFVFNDGETLAFDGGELKVVHTPGHESGHCCFLEPHDGLLFTGDHILGRGTTVVAPPDGDMALYLQSLEKLRDLDMEVILPGHGPAIDDPHAKIEEYLSHRLARERQILAEVEREARTIGAVTERIYAGIEPVLMPAARRSVEAHLIKLEREGLVARDGDRYRSTRKRGR